MRPHPRRARTDPHAPAAWATDDRSGFVGNNRDLLRQVEWAGTKLVDTGILVFADEYDEPQRQLGTLLLPPDPPAVMSARPEQYDIDEQPVTARATMDGRIRATHLAPYPQERIVSVAGNLAGV